MQLAATLREESERAKREKRTVEDVMENVLKSRRGEKGHAELAQYQAGSGKPFLKSKFFENIFYSKLFLWEQWGFGKFKIPSES